MLRVYLDQNKWVELARSHKGGFADELGDVWHLAQAGVDAGLLSFPLSPVHYFETSKRVDKNSRWRLAATMAELSRVHTMVGSSTLVPAEVEAAVDKILSGSPSLILIPVFGRGAAHALGADPDTFRGRSSIDELGASGMPEDMLDLVRRGVVDADELAVLARTESSVAARLIAELTRSRMGTVDRKFADAQRSFADDLRNLGLTHRRDEGLSRVDLMDVMPLFTRALAVRGRKFKPEQFHDVDVVNQLLKEVPSKWVVREMRRVRHRNLQQPWTESDLNDMNALSGAVVYCDVVVTERQWAHHLTKEGVAELYNTTVISDLHALPELILDDSRDL